MRLAEHLVIAIDEWNATHPRLTTAEIEAAFEEIEDALAEAAMSHDRNRSFGENVIPFVR